MSESYPAPEQPEGNESLEAQIKRAQLFAQEGIPDGLSSDDDQELQAPDQSRRGRLKDEMIGTRNELFYESNIEKLVSLKRIKKAWEAEDFSKIDQIFQSIKITDRDLFVLFELWQKFTNSSKDKLAKYEFGSGLNDFMEKFLEDPDYQKAERLMREFGHPKEMLDEAKFTYEEQYNEEIDILKKLEADLKKAETDSDTAKSSPNPSSQERIRNLQNEIRRIRFSLRWLKQRLKEKNVQIPPNGEKFDPPSG